MKQYSLLIWWLVLFAGCNSLKTAQHVLLNTSPYEIYVQSLNKAGLKDKPITQEWLQAGQRALNDSITVLLPYAESGFFQGTEPDARSYRFQMKAGQVLTLAGKIKTAPGAQLFVDLLIWKENQWKEFLHADSALVLHAEFETDQYCLLRIQPELLVDIWYSFTLSAAPALINPVKGATNKSIGSFYGNVRDNGKRSHEGIDIFAPKGTYVVAPTNGLVTDAGNNNLGGKVVWLYDAKRGQTYYFAHLDSQWVRAMQQVKQGEIIGQVGNTGNALHTAAHLHFGLYRNGSKDPLNYVQTTAEISPIALDTTFTVKGYKVLVKEGKFYNSPIAKSQLLYSEPKETYVKIIAQSGDWVRVIFPEKQQAYIRKKELTPLDKGKLLVLKKTDTLWSTTGARQLPMSILALNESVQLLAQYKGYAYVQTSDKTLGWLKL